MPVRSSLSRRTFLSAAGGLAAGAALSACSGFTKSSEPAATSDNTLAFTTWASDPELAGFKKAVAGFEAANPGVTVQMNVVPFAQFFQNIDAQLQSNTAPDLFRVDYRQFGKYAGRQQLLDLSSLLDPSVGSSFTDALWRAVQYQGKPYGVPHHTDTSAILYNKSLLASAGITQVPTTLDTAWTWEQFEDVAKTLQGKLPKGVYPFAVNWQGLAVTRWLSWLYQADGRFLDEALTAPAIDSDAGRAAVDFTKSFFSKGYVPQNDSTKSATYASDTFLAGSVAMVFSGAFAIPDAMKTAKFEFGATFSPRNKRGGGDLGGNALVATAGTKKGELAAKFLTYVTQEQPMNDFCATASLLPTRKDLVSKGIQFAVRPELSPVFVGQATTVRAQDAAQYSSPSMAAITTVLTNQLEQAFIGGQSTQDTLTNMTSGIKQALTT